MSNRVSSIRDKVLMASIVLMPAMELLADTTKKKANTTGGAGLTGIVSSITEFIKALGPLIGAIALVAGLMFFVASVFTFKQHRDNPTQVPVGKPIAQMCVSVALMFMGNIINPIGESFFGGGDTDAKNVLEPDSKAPGKKPAKKKP